MFFSLALSGTFLAIYSFYYAHKNKRTRKLYPKIKNEIMKDQKPQAIATLAKHFGISDKKMLKRIDAVLDAGYMPDMYIDYSIMYLMFKEDLSNENLNYEYLKDDHFISVYCHTCGATNKMLSKENRYCHYCKNPCE